MMPVSHFSTLIKALLLSIGGFKSPGRGRGGGGGMRGGRRVIIEAHRHEGDYAICQHEYVCMHTHTHIHTSYTHHYRGMLCRKFWGHRMDYATLSVRWCHDMKFLTSR